MITGIFLLHLDSFVCSNHVDMEVKGDVKRQTLLIAKNCYSPKELPEVNEMVDCVIKYEVSPPINCKVTVRSVDNKMLVLSIASTLQVDGSQQLLSRIACLL